jgi:hypothetical protein
MNSITDPKVSKVFFTEGYVSGDCECFCIASAVEPRNHDKEKRVYPDEWFQHLDKTRKYRFKIAIEAEEIEGWEG